MTSEMVLPVHLVSSQYHIIKLWEGVQNDEKEFIK